LSLNLNDTRDLVGRTEIGSEFKLAY